MIFLFYMSICHLNPSAALPPTADDDNDIGCRWCSAQSQNNGIGTIHYGQNFHLSQFSFSSPENESIWRVPLPVIHSFIHSFISNQATRPIWWTWNEQKEQNTDPKKHTNQTQKHKTKYYCYFYGVAAANVSTSTNDVKMLNINMFGSWT